MFSISTRWWWISAAAILSSINFTNAQSLHVARYEVMLDRSEVGYKTLSSNDEGLFLQRMGIGPKFDHIELIHLDTALSEKWKGTIAVEKNYQVFGQTVFENKLYLLLRYRDYSRNDLVLISVENETGNYVQYKIKGYIPFAPTDFQVMKRGVIIGGYFNRTPLALFFSLEDYKSRVLAGLLNETGELNQIRVNNDDDTFDLVISAPNLLRQRTIWLKRYDGQGNLISNTSLDSPDKHLIFGRLLTTNDNMQIVAGVYGNRSTEYSRGIFISTIDPTGYQQMRYYSFGDLENFFKYMKAKREKRVKERIERRKIRGKKTRFNYRFLLHQMIPYNDQFLLLGEAFYPKYSYVNSNPMFFGARSNYSTFQSGRVFDGYYYTHAVIMAFNKQGDLLWDNSFEIKDVKSFRLEQFVRAKLFEDRISLFYIYDNKLRSKVIKNNDVLEAKSQDLSHNAYEVNRPIGSTASTLNYWYGDVLFANGLEDVETPGGRHKRRVFYVSKIRVSAP